MDAKLPTSAADSDGKNECARELRRTDIDQLEERHREINERIRYGRGEISKLIRLLYGMTPRTVRSIHGAGYGKIFHKLGDEIMRLTREYSTNPNENLHDALDAYHAGDGIPRSAIRAIWDCYDERLQSDHHITKQSGFHLLHKTFLQYGLIQELIELGIRIEDSALSPLCTIDCFKDAKFTEGLLEMQKKYANNAFILQQIDFALRDIQRTSAQE